MSEWLLTVKDWCHITEGWSLSQKKAWWQLLCLTGEKENISRIFIFKYLSAEFS